MAQGGDLGERAAAALAALRLRRRRAAGAGRAGRPGLPHRRAHLLLPDDRRPRRSRRTRRCPRSRARSRRATARCRRAATRPSCSGPVPSGSGAKVEEEAEEVARAGREERDERLREEAADLLYHLGVLLEARGPDVRRRARRADRAHGSESLAMAVATLQPARDPVARRGARARARPQRDPAAPHVHRRLRDPGVGVPEAARARPRVPARVGRAGTALRPLLVPRLPPARAAALRGRRGCA